MKIYVPPSYDKINLFDVNHSYTKSTNIKSGNDDSQMSVKVDISEEAKVAYRSYIQENNVTGDTPLYAVTIDDTNELEMEHFFAMQESRNNALSHTDYSIEDVMKSIVSAYENRYNEIVKAHENGERQVSYDIAGETSLTLEQDLAGLNKAYDREVSMLKGYIWCQKTSDGCEFFNKIHSYEEELNTNRYIDNSQKMLEKVRDRLLRLRQSSDYRVGMSINVLSEFMSHNPYFIKESKNLLAHTRFYTRQ